MKALAQFLAHQSDERLFGERTGVGGDDATVPVDEHCGREADAAELLQQIARRIAERLVGDAGPLDQLATRTDLILDVDPDEGDISGGCDGRVRAPASRSRTACRSWRRS